MPVIFHRLALSEFRRGYAHYRRQDADVAIRFRSAVENAASRIDQYPSIGSPCYTYFRWVRIKKFKYLLYYRQLTDSLVLIYAVAHTSRRSGYWLRRTRRP